MLSYQSGELSPETKRPPFGGETPSGGLTATLVLEGSWLSWLIFPIRPDLKVGDAIVLAQFMSPAFPAIECVCRFGFWLMRDRLPVLHFLRHSNPA